MEKPGFENFTKISWLAEKNMKRVFGSIPVIKGKVNTVPVFGSVPVFGRVTKNV